MSESQGATIQSIFSMLMKSQYWSPKEMLIFQRTQLEQLLRHAKANVPFYQKRLDCVFRRDDSIDWERWNEIPIVTREDLRDRREEMQARVLPPGHGQRGEISSSGSTGVPITYTVSQLAGEVSQQAWTRFFRARDLPNTGNWAEFKTVDYHGLPISKDIDRLTDDASAFQRFIINKYLGPTQRLDILEELRIDVLLTSPNDAEIVAALNKERTQPLKLNCLIGIGQGFSQFQRELIQDSFGCEILSPYSSKEGTLMAFECYAGGPFHLNVDTCKFEFLDNKNQAVEVGKSGRVVITPFFQTAQPLIRYDQGDLATPGTTCVCNRTLPVLQHIDGRQDQIFRFPDKQVAVQRVNERLTRDVLGAIALQIAQTAPLHIEVRYVSFADASADKLESFTAHLRSVIHPNAEYTFKRMNDLPSNAGGKKQRYVREF